MYFDSSLSLVPWELLGYLFLPWEMGKFQTEVFGMPDRSAGGHVF